MNKIKKNVQKALVVIVALATAFQALPATSVLADEAVPETEASVIETAAEGEVTGIDENDGKETALPEMAIMDSVSMTDDTETTVSDDTDAIVPEIVSTPETGTYDIPENDVTEPQVDVPEQTEQQTEVQQATESAPTEEQKEDGTETIVEAPEIAVTEPEADVTEETTTESVTDETKTEPETTEPETEESKDGTDKEESLPAYEDIGVIIAEPVINGVLAYPLPAGYSTVTSSFGYRTGEFAGFHTGTDISAPKGTPIYAAKAGTVIISDFGASQGNYVVIDHGNGVYTEYHHMSVRHAAAGDAVSAGQVIGEVGATGTASGDHLHFMVMISDHGYDIGTVVNPYDYIFADGAIRSLGGIDFSSNRIIVMDPASVMFADSLISSYKGVYLYQFDNEADAKLAYLYYLGNANSVEADTGISIAEGEAAENVVTDTVMTEEENPLTELAETGNVGTYDIALIDTGATGANASVSMIGDYTGDDNGHGTAMLGYIREQSPNARVLSIKALGSDGKGDVSALYAAIQYAISQNVKVINLSVSALASEDSRVVEEAINEAVGRGIVVVGAAGNNGKNAGYYIPGGVQAAYIIGAAGQNGVRLASSNYGATVDYNVVADSTSEAAAKFSSFTVANGIASIADVLNKGLIYSTDYVDPEGGEPDETAHPGYVIPGIYYAIEDEYGFHTAADSIVVWGRTDCGEADLILRAKVDGETVIAYCVHPWNSKTPDGNQDYYARTETRNALGYIMEHGAHEVGQSCWGLGEMESQFITQLAVFILVNDGNESADSVLYNQHTNSQGGAVASFYAMYCNIFGEDAADAHIGYAKTLAANALRDGSGYGNRVSGWKTNEITSYGVGYQEVITYNPVRTAPVTVRKTSSDSACTAQLVNNDMYSHDFSGAEFKVTYVDKNGNTQTVTKTTGTNGSFTVEDVKIGTTFTATETKAPKGYELPTGANATKSITIVSENAASNTLTFSDKPSLDPAWLTITKVKYVNGQAVETAAVSGAIFKVEYFDNMNWSGTPERTWYYESNEQGRVIFRWESYLSTNPNYPSDPRYYSSGSGDAMIPLGTVRVTEVYSPSGVKLVTESITGKCEFDSTGKSNTSWTIPQSNMFTTESDGTITVADPQKYGTIVVNKEDIYTGSTPQGDGSFDGIEVTVKNVSGETVYFEDGSSLANNGTKKLTFANGNESVTLSGVPLGSYEITETKGNASYKQNADWTVTATLSDNGTDTLTTAYSDGTKAVVKDTIVKGNIEGLKMDAETEDGSATAGLSLEGAEVTLINASMNAVKKENADIATAKTALGTNPSYDTVAAVIESSPNAVYAVMTTDASGRFHVEDVPYGTYFMIETKQPEGYTLNKDWVKKVEIREDGKLYSYNDKDESRADCALKNFPIRRDFEFLKVSIDGNIDDNPLAYVPFLLTRYGLDGEIIEQHVFVTDGNGHYRSADHDKEAANVNSLDAYNVDGSYMKNGSLSDGNEADSKVGVWFGSQEARSNERGALVYGIYDIQELTTVRNSGNGENIEVSHVPFEIKEESETPYVVGVAVDVPVKIETDALDVTTGTKMTPVGSEVPVQDTITHHNLDSRDKYKWVIRFVDSENINKVVGETVIDNWSPERDNAYYTVVTGTVTADMTVDTTSFAKDGGKIVALVYLYQYTTHSTQPLLIANHADLADERETLYVPGISTNANDKLTSDHVGAYSENDRIQDVVTVKNLAERSRYKLVASLYERLEDGSEVLFDSVESVTKSFSAGRNMITTRNIEMPEFTLDSTVLNGKTLVVYEDLYWIDEVDDGVFEEIIIASHREILDEKQSIHYPDIETHAWDGDTKDQVGSVKPEAVLYDNVHGRNLIVGETYEVGGDVHYKEDVLDENGNVLHKAGDVFPATLTEATLDGEALTITNGRASFTVPADGDKTSRELDILLKYELDSTALEGYSAVVFEDFYHNGVEVGHHEDLEDEDQTVRYPKVRTNAADKETLDDVGAVKTNATITDTVSLTNLKYGMTYTVTGRLMNQMTGEEVVMDSLVMTPVTFVADETLEGAEVSADGNYVNGTVQITFEGIDATKLEDTTVVVFEKLLHPVNNEGNDVEVARHEDLSDKGQSIHYPKIETNATDTRTGDHVGSIFGKLINAVRVLFGEDVLEEGEQEIVDTVTLHNLVPGRSYTVDGVLMNKATNEPVQIDGKEVTQTATFTVTENGKIVADNGEKTTVTKYDKEHNRVDGTIDLTFRFDSSVLIKFNTPEEESVTTVVFETLKYNDIEIAVHKDIEDLPQTVTEVSIHTTAIDKETGDHTGDTPRRSSTHDSVKDARESVIEDTVHMEGLVEGQEYILKGYLVIKEDSSADKPMYLKADGTTSANKNDAISAGKSFTADAAVMDITLDFDVTSELVAGKTVVVFETLFHNGVMISVHADIADEDQSIHYTEIGTTAWEDGNPEDFHAANAADGMTTVKDKVVYKNLNKGVVYSMTGTLMIREDNAPLLGKDGNPVTATVYFVAGSEGTFETKEEALEKGENTLEDKEYERVDGSVVLEFTFDAAELEDKTVVAFEELEYNEKTIEVHADINDEPQSVHIPKVETEATSEGTHAGLAAKDITIEDRVDYKNLIVGKDYSVTGVLMVQETGEPLLDNDGKEITNTVTFTAEEEDGYIVIPFTIDASLLAGKSIVVFEEVKNDDITVAIHHDIEDESQTVHFPEIGTVLKDNNGQKLVYGSINAIMVDEVAYKNLVNGTYTMYGKLMSRTTGECVAEGHTVFTVDSKEPASSGTVLVDFKLDTYYHKGEILVAYEYLVEGEVEKLPEDHIKAIHDDIDDEEQAIYIPKIGTEAKATDGTKVIEVAEKAIILDTVRYEGLIPGKEYNLKALIYNATTKKVLEGVTGTAKFTASEPNGEAVVEIEVDTRDLTNNVLVAAEELYIGETLIADHKDPNDEGQTVYVPEIGTIAASKTGSKVITCGKDTRFIDTVEYKNLDTKATYVVKGSVFDKTAGKILDGVTAQAEFTPKTANGKIALEFSVDTSSIAGHKLVVFEELFVVTKDDDGKTVERPVVDHKNPDDEAQTVTVETPVPTGDGFNMNLWLMIALAALVIMGGAFGTVICIRRKSSK